MGKSFYRFPTEPAPFQRDFEMHAYIAAAAMAFIAASSADANLLYSYSAGAKNVASVNPVTFQPAPPVDLYNFYVQNTGAVPVAALQLRFEGNFVNNNSASGVTFKEGTNLPAFGPFSIADSFFVLPMGDLGNNLPAPGQTIDNGVVLAAAYTLSGTPRLIPGGSTQTVAVLAVPAGSSQPLYYSLTYGAAVIGSELIVFATPEPTTCVLAGLALVGAAARRRV